MSALYAIFYIAWHERKGQLAMTNIHGYDGKSPELHGSVFVAPTASIIGDAHFAADSSAFYGVVVRADTAPIWVGTGSNLQDNVVLHADPGFPAAIGAGVSIGHGAVVHGCTVEDDCLIGMGAIVLNGAIVGAGSLVAAGAVVLEGTVIPPRSLVAGVPAKVRRALTAEEFAGVQENAVRYVELGREHRVLHTPI